jgi:hypothetical protein
MVFYACKQVSVQLIKLTFVGHHEPDSVWERLDRRKRFPKKSEETPKWKLSFDFCTNPDRQREKRILFRDG